MDPTLEAAYLRCEEIARSHYENFPVVSRFLSGSARRALAAVYAFARGADDFADEGYGPGGPSSAERLTALDAWERRLREACGLGQERTARSNAMGQDAEPVFIALEDTVRRHDLDPGWLLELLSAFRQDVLVSRYGTREELLGYCRRSANPVGRIVLAVHGIRDEASTAASDSICTALQLANFWQDVSVDRTKDRIYLPREDRDRHGVREDDLDAAAASPALRRLILEETAWTRSFFEDGRRLIDDPPAGLGMHLRLIWLGGTRVLEMIEAAEGDVLAVRPKLGRSDIVRLVLRALAYGLRR